MSDRAQEPKHPATHEAMTVKPDVAYLFGRRATSSILRPCRHASSLEPEASSIHIEHFEPGMDDLTIQAHSIKEGIHGIGIGVDHIMHAPP